MNKDYCWTIKDRAYSRPSPVSTTYIGLTHYARLKSSSWVSFHEILLSHETHLRVDFCLSVHAMVEYQYGHHGFSDSNAPRQIRNPLVFVCGVRKHNWFGSTNKLEACFCSNSYYAASCVSSAQWARFVCADSASKLFAFRVSQNREQYLGVSFSKIYSRVLFMFLLTGWTERRRKFGKEQVHKQNLDLNVTAFMNNCQYLQVNKFKSLTSSVDHHTFPQLTVNHSPSSSLIIGLEWRNHVSTPT